MERHAALSQSLRRVARGTAVFGGAWVVLTLLGGREFAAEFGLSLLELTAREVIICIVCGALIWLLLPIAKSWAGAFAAGVIVMEAFSVMLWRSSPVLRTQFGVSDVFYNLGPIFALLGGFCAVTLRSRWLAKRQRGERENL